METKDIAIIVIGIIAILGIIFGRKIVLKSRFFNMNSEPIGGRNRAKVKGGGNQVIQHTGGATKNASNNSANVNGENNRIEQD